VPCNMEAFVAGSLQCTSLVSLHIPLAVPLNVTFSAVHILYFICILGLDTARCMWEGNAVVAISGEGSIGAKDSNNCSLHLACVNGLTEDRHGPLQSRDIGAAINYGSAALVLIHVHKST
jgi:hypothetical protein